MNISSFYSFKSLDTDIKRCLIGRHSVATAYLPRDPTSLLRLIDDLASNFTFFKEWYPKRAASALKKRLLPALLVGDFPFLTDDFARLIRTVHYTYCKVQAQLSKLSREERQALERHLSEKARSYLGQRWHKFERLCFVAFYTAGISDLLLECGSIATEVASNCLLPLVVSEEKQRSITAPLAIIGNDFLKSVDRAFCKSVTCLAKESLSYFYLHGMRKFVPLFAEQLHAVFNNFSLIEEVLCKIDVWAKELTPKQFASLLLSSLEQFSRVNTGSSKEIEKLYQAAKQSLLPWKELSDALSLLFNGGIEAKALKKQWFCLLESASLEHPISSEKRVAVGKEFEQFCSEHKLDRLSASDQEFIQAAFLAKASSQLSRNQQLALLADLALLNPEQGMRGAIDGSLLMERAAILYIEQKFYPAVLKRFFPKDFSHLMGGLSKLFGGNVEKSCGQLLALQLVQLVLKTLTDAQVMANSILSSLGSSTNKKTGDEELKEWFNHVTDDLDWVSRLYVGSTSKRVGEELTRLSKRKDWALWLLLFAGLLCKGLENPEAVSPLNLLETSTIRSLQESLKLLLPSAAWAPTAKPLQCYLKSAQKWLDGLHYQDLVSPLSDELRVQAVIALALNHEKFQSSTPEVKGTKSIESELGSFIRKNINEAPKKIWGQPLPSKDAALCRKLYIDFLLEQRPKKLLSIARLASENPEAVREMLIRREELALTCSLREPEFDFGSGKIR